MFYLKPPRGLIHREKLLDLSLKRLRVLRDVLDASDYPALLQRHVEASDAVAEGGVRDRIAHHALLLCAARRGGGAVREYVASRETRLFRLRVRGLDVDSLEGLLLELLRHLQERLRLLMDRTLMDVLNAVCELSDSGLLRRDDDVSVRVPFPLALSLVRSRQVELVDGMAVLTRQHVPDFLESLFEILLQRSMTHLERSATEEDELGELSDAIVASFLADDAPSWDSRTATLRAVQVAAASGAFPPCMAHLHSVLGRQHRLPHESRVAYTLFLKELGLPLEEAVAFWSGHLSRRPGAAARCAHSWQRDGRRFDYSVRFLYGRRGRGTDYSSHSCRTIQRIGASSPTTGLLCPFAALAGRELRGFLTDLRPEGGNTDAAVALAERGQTMQACGAFMSGVSARELGQETFVKCRKPVHFARLSLPS